MSNESPQDVFFDNVTIQHHRGLLLAEDHYYPFGLEMSSLSSQAANKIDNLKKFNGNELQTKEFTVASLEWTDFNARIYDQQTGRFIQIDPTPSDGNQETFTPYHFGGNNPILNNDPNGKCPWCIIGFFVGAAADYVAQVVANKIEGKSWSDALTDVDGKEVFAAGVGGALTGGVTSLYEAAEVTVTKLLLSKTVAKATAVGIASIALQMNENEQKGQPPLSNISPVKIALDIATDNVAEKIGDKIPKLVTLNNANVKEAVNDIKTSAVSTTIDLAKEQLFSQEKSKVIAPVPVTNTSDYTFFKKQMVYPFGKQ